MCVIKQGLSVLKKHDFHLYNQCLENLQEYSNIYAKKLIIFYFLFKDEIPNHLLFEDLKNILILGKNDVKYLNNKYLDTLKHIRDYIGVSNKEKTNFGEVFTPNFIVNAMLDALPKDVWSNKNLKWLDPANGIGNYPAVIIPRLMDGLKNIIHDDEERYKHIMNNMIYVCDIQEKNMFSYCMLFDIDDKYNLNIYKGDFLKEGFEKQMKRWNINKFDIIIGNPPYQKMDAGNKASAKPLYDKFIVKSLEIGNMISFITPSRWFAGGKGLDGFRDMMLNRTDIPFIKHFEHSNLVFNDVDIKGGVSYFIINKNYCGLCNFNGIDIPLNNYDIIPTNINSFSIIDKVNKNLNLSSIAYSRAHYQISTNMILPSTKIDENHIKVYFSTKNNNEKWINKKYIKENTSINKWKVITPRAAHKECSGFGRIFISKPNEICNDSFIHFGVETEDEAIYLKHYLETRFVNFLLGLKKISQDISLKTLSWIPLISLDRYWNDVDLYNKFGLTKEEIKIIEDNEY